MPAGRARGAFTLAEVLIASAIFVLMVTLVMSTVVAQSKFGMAIGNYSDMNEYSRKVLTQFEQDMRMTTSVTAMKDTEVTTTVINDVNSWNTTPPTLPTASTVRYYFDSAAGTLYRAITPPGGSATTTAVLKGLTTCRFSYFNTDDIQVTPGTTGDLGSVKKIMLTGTLSRSAGGTTNSNTDQLVSAVVIMISKPGSRT